MSATTPTDELLIPRIRAGDMQAFDALYARYERRLFGYIRRMVADPQVAEDLFQDVFFTVLADRSYDPERGRFGAWLFRVARNRCLQHQRSDHDRARCLQRERETHGRQVYSAGAVEAASEARQAVASLDDGQRQLLLLKQVAELTYRDIAEILGEAEGTIKSRIHTIMTLLRQRLAPVGGGPQ